MILTPMAPDALRRALSRFCDTLRDGHARRLFHRLAPPTQSRRARGATAAAHRRVAIRLARRLGMGTRPGAPRLGFGWDGKAARSDTEAYVLLHEVAHFQLAAPRRRRQVEFGLGPGPETGARAAAARAATLDGLPREAEEAAASLLGVLWEAALGQPALASLLDQNWLEGAGRPGAARHFETVLARLRRDGFVTAAGRPIRRLRSVRR